MACSNLPVQFPSGLTITINNTAFNNPQAPGRLLSLSLRGSKKGKASAFFSSSIGSLRPELDENPEAIISGEWPENFSFLTLDDLRFYLESHTDNDQGLKIGPSMLLREAMSTSVLTVTTEETLEDIEPNFKLLSGLPVVDDQLKCVGVISKSDTAKASQGLKSRVGEVMSSPAITLPPNKTVKDAAALMLKMKIHRIPIVNEKAQVIGMVTRTDIFQALEALEVLQVE